MTTITINGVTYNLVALPTSIAPVELTFGMTDAVAMVPSPYVPGQFQTQAWPGADMWDMTVTMPPLSDALAAEWEGFLAELRGMQNCFQMGDPRRKTPLGRGLGTPQVATGNTVSSTNLITGNWTPSIARLLLRGDLIQVGYRLHKVCETVASDAFGGCTIPIWPSLREVVATGTSVILNNPQGLWRLAENRRQSGASKLRAGSMSFRCVECR
ncbi:MAG: hypothetical protein KGL39_18500 [Patescibacteria group bacterium]|nr:hypothetical protein [Patescibacteria group bacterium]